jgi:hypothetical protein
MFPYYTSREFTKEFRPTFFFLKLLPRFNEIVGTAGLHNNSVTDLTFE